jgi:putative aldouronate transport system permease protein
LLRKARRGKGVLHELFSNRALYLMTIPALLFLIVFNYVPMYGIQIAFRNFNVVDGISRSPFVGLKNFAFFFKSDFFYTITFNTLYLNFLFISTGVLTQVSTAILINEVLQLRLKKLFQTAMFFPYFISWVIVTALVTSLLSERFGLVNRVLTQLGLETVVWYFEPKIWPAILTVASIWKGLGYGVVIYLAKIAGIDAEIYEAARIDGAGKFHEIRHITLPMLIPTVVLLLLIAIGGIFRGDFGMIYSLIGDNGLLLTTTEIIDTYVYRAMRINAQYGMAAAIGLYQSVMGFGLVLLSNYLVKRYDRSMGIF